MDLMLLILSLLGTTQDDVARQAREFIDRFHSENVEERNKAELALRALGKAAEAELEKASSDKDPEIAGRVRSVLAFVALRRIEERLNSSQTARIRVKTWVEIKSKPASRVTSAILLLKDANRVSWNGGVLTHFCDGRKIRDSRGTNEPGNDAPRDFREKLTLLISRVGLDPAIHYAFGLLDTGGLEEAFRRMTETVEIQQIQFGADDADTKMLSYLVVYFDKLRDGVQKWQVSLWYDPAAHKILKRCTKRDSMTFWEVYSEWALNELISDDAFKTIEERITEYSQEIVRDPKNSRAHLNRGQARMQKGEFESGIEDFTRCIELYPKAIEAYTARGTGRIAQKKYKEAQEDFSTAIQLDPSGSSSYLGRARARSCLNDHKGVIEDCSRVLTLDRDSVNALVLRGFAYILSEQFNLAIVDLGKAEELSPRTERLLSYKALALAGAGKDVEAIHQAERAFAIDVAGLDYAFAARALANLHLGKKEQASEDLGAFESLASESDPLRSLVVRWRKQFGLEK